MGTGLGVGGGGAHVSRDWGKAMLADHSSTGKFIDIIRVMHMEGFLEHGRLC